MSTEDEFMRGLRATFTLEAEEHLHQLATGLLELEKAPEPDARRRTVEAIFRAAHSLKGAARAVDFPQIEAQCQSLEDTFAAWKRQQAVPSPAALEAAHRTLDTISAAVPRSQGPPAPGVPSAPSRGPSEATRVAEPLPRAAAAPEKLFAGEETVRVVVPKLYARLSEAEEMLVAKLALDRHVEELRELRGRFEAWRREWTAVEPDARALRQAIDRPSPGGDAAWQARAARMVDFVERHVQHLMSAEAHVGGLTMAMSLDRQLVGKLVDDLLDGAKDLLLMPFGTLTAPFPKLVRDLCRDLGKSAELVIQGEDVEIDKRILEDMKDPLVHLLRNAIDHGIEMPQQRLVSGKPGRGTITLAAAQANTTMVEIAISDDGAGIDLDKVKASAVEHGLVSAADAPGLGDARASTLIFESEVSTSPVITELSGRGLGLAIVREKAENLGGTVTVESQLRRGTRFSILLPSTLATFRGILVEAAQRRYILPTLHVQCVAPVDAEGIRTVEGRDTISLHGRAVALVRLADTLDLPHAGHDDAARPAKLAVVLGTGDGRIAFAVDAILDEQEVLVKHFRKPLSRVRNIAAATVLSSGDVVPILHVSDLLKSARKSGGIAVRQAPAIPRSDAAQKSILVAEDSITSRMLIKGILESAGYTVRTAVDGMEAFALLRAEHFDLLVSDVEMPRLNGFDLTAAIRADKRLAELPVVLVTARDSPDDRARGIDVGADAYIVKSSFEHSNLLGAVRRLA